MKEARLLSNTLSDILGDRNRMTFDNSVGADLELKRSFEDHFRGLLMSGLSVEFDDEPDLFIDLMLEYGRMVRGEDRKDEIFSYFPLEFKVVNGMPGDHP